jgi:predicted RNA-binding protein with PUA-like domain
LTACWLVKSEPGAYSFDDLVRDGSTCWDGVRNAEARNNLQAMRVNDAVLYYHSNVGKEVVGRAVVTRTAYQDPTTDDERWVVVDLAPVRAFDTPVPLTRIKADASLRTIKLVTHSRLSVMPLPKAAFDRIVKLGGAVAPPAKKYGVKRAGTSKPGRPRTRSSASHRGP